MTWRQTSCRRLGAYRRSDAGVVASSITVTKWLKPGVLRDQAGVQVFDIPVDRRLGSLMESEKIEALERLGKLLDDGKLTAREYEDLKQELLVLRTSRTEKESVVDTPSGVSEPQREPVADQTRSVSLTSADPQARSPARPEQHRGSDRERDELAGETSPIFTWMLLVVLALVANIIYWAVEATLAFDIAFEPTFWTGPVIPGWITTWESAYPWVLIGTAALFVTWSYRAHANLRLLGRTGMQHKDHETVWWWLVPVANFFMPYKVIYETMRGTVAPLDDRNWGSSKVPSLVPGWATTFIAGIVITGVSKSMIDSALSVDELTTGSTGYLIGACALCVAALVASDLVVQATRAQGVQMRRLMGAGSDSKPAIEPQQTRQKEGSDLLRRLVLGRNYYRD